MNRIPEPELMNDEAQAQAYAATDFSEAHDTFVSEFALRFPDFSTGHILDLGSGTADVIIRFARRFTDTMITGVDGSHAMLDIGEKAVESSGLTNRIKLLNTLLPDRNISAMQFDVVMSNSILHHLNNPMVLWYTAVSCTIPGSLVFIMDLMRSSTAEEARRLVKVHAPDAPEILQRDFFNSLLAAYSLDEVNSQLKSAGLEYLTTEVISDRHFIAWGTRQ